MPLSTETCAPASSGAEGADFGGEPPPEIFTGGGAMGKMVREKDWSLTPFGPIGTWPQSLKTATALMLESSFAMVVAWGPEFRFLYNDRYQPILGSKHPSALGAPARDVFPEVWSGFIEPLFVKACSGEPVAIDDLLIPLHRHGYLENCYFSIAYSPIRDESRGVGGMLAVVAETTQRVESERRLTTLRDLARSAAETKGAEEACIQAATILGENRTDIPYSVIYLLDSDGERARRVAHSGLPTSHRAAAATVDVGCPDPLQWPFEAALRLGKPLRVDGLAERWEPLPSGPFPEPVDEALILPLSRPGARPYGFLVAAISARRRLDDRYRDFLELVAEHATTAIANARALEDERRRADALAEIDRAKTAFFSNISHEFRTPLTLMLGPLQDLLAAGNAQAADVRPSLELVHRNSLRLLKLVNALLDFSRMESGRLQARFEPVNLPAYTAELAGVFRSAMDKAGLAYSVDCPPASEPAYVDRDLWEKVVFNLLSNALKFTRSGSISVALRETGRGFELEVRDTGSGIPPAEMPNLFKRFHRIDNPDARSHEGSGIGLALVHEIVKLHGGQVAASSRPGEGTAFVVSIPAGSSHLPAGQVAPAAPAPKRVNAPGGAEEALRWADESPGGEAAEAFARGAGAPPKRPGLAPTPAHVLLADDNADMRDYVRRLLSTTHTVETVPDGAAAIAAIRRRRPDLVVADVMMPRLDGFGLVRAIRSDPDLSGLPIILLSARAGAEATEDGYAAGADDYICKPFTARALISRVNAHLNLARLRREVAAKTDRLRALEMDADQVNELVPAALCRCDAEGRITFYNRRLADLLGVEPELRQPWSTFAAKFGLGPPGGPPLESDQSPLLVAARTGASFRDVELEVTRPDGNRLIAHAAIEPITDAQGRLTGAIMAMHDVTARARAERNALALSQLSQDLALAAEEHELMDAALRAVGHHLGADRCHLVELDGPQACLVRGWSAEDLPGVESAQPWADFVAPGWRPPPGTITVGVGDVRTHPATRPASPKFEALGLRAIAAASFQRAGRVVALLAATSRSRREWRPDELSLLESAMMRTWPMIERARAARQLQASEEQLRRLYAESRADLARTKAAELASRQLAAIVESSDDAIVSKDLNGRITSWNDAARRIFGYTAEEIIGQSILTLIPPERHDEERSIIERIRNGIRVEHFETVRQRKDGKRIDLSITVSPVRDRDGVVIGASKVARDIGARRRAEAGQKALHDLLAAVNKASALPDVYEAAIEAVMRSQEVDRAAILLCDERRIMRFVAWRGISEGYRSAVEGHSPWHADERDPKPVCIDDVTQAALAPGLRAVVAQEGIRALAFIPLTYEHRLLGKLMLYYDRPHAFDAADLRLTEALATQVAFAVERQRSAEALETTVRDRTQSLREAIEQMEEFSYSVSHDLRSPVRAMRGYAEVLLEEHADKLDDEGRDLLARIGRSGKRMDQLIQDLLTYSRLNRRQVVLGPVALGRLIVEVIQQYPELHAERADIEVVQPLPEVIAHEPSLTQVISNLLSNAVKFVAPGVRPRVRIHAERQGAMVRVWIDDNGIGIRPELQRRLFGLFERLHTDRRFEGTGIGLAIVRKAMERMNGRIGMMSDGVAGSRFWIELPASLPISTPAAP